jgi:hypothetical protein
MKLVLRGSEYTDFLTCRKKWLYGWVEKITPKRPNNKLFFGTAFHKWLEEYYNTGCNKLSADLVTSVWINDQDTSGMEQTELDELMALLKGVATNYDKTYQENDSQWKILATELEFVIKLEDELYMTGTIDLVYEVDGKIRFSDHKTVSSISQYEEKSKMDRQISRYWWVLKMIASGIAMVKNAQSEWVQMDSLIGKEIDGFDYNLILKDVPKPPELLKKGGLSKAKNQKTTYELYLNKLDELQLYPAEYTEILEHLKNKPDPYFKRINVQRTSSELDSAAWEFLYTAGDIHDVKLMIAEHPDRLEPLTYRNIGTHCDHMCQFKTLCQTTIEGGNVSLVKNLAYIKNEERQKEEKK